MQSPQQPSSPGPAYSDAGSTGRGGFGLLGSLKKALPRSPRPHSPASSFGGSDLGTPPSRSKLGFPSFSNGQRKREIIKKLEDEVHLLQMQSHQRESDLVQLQQQVALTSSAREEAQERLNMQYFKSHLLVDMLVAKLLDLEALSGAPTPAAAAANGAVAVVHVTTPHTAVVPQQVTVAAKPQVSSVLAEDSFE